MKNNFEEFGFKGKFGGEILKEIEQPKGKTYSNYNYIGYVVGGNGLKYPCVWNEFGQCGLCTSAKESKYDLTPIKKEWYKDENNIGKLIKSDKFNTFAIFREYKDNKIFIEFNNYSWDVDLFRPATKEEINSIVIKE